MIIEKIEQVLHFGNTCVMLTNRKEPHSYGKERNFLHISHVDRRSGID